MRALSLFSGIGLHDLGLQRAGLEIAGQVEIDPWCSAVLAKHWPDVPRWEDIRLVEPDELLARCGRIDLVTGGSPCQNISLAGRGEGLSGPKSGLWKQMLRIVRGLAPSWVLLENVPALRTRGAVEVVSDLEAEGYAVFPPSVVGAWACGAPHRRDRAWIVARRSVGDAESHDERGSRQGSGKQRLADRGSSPRAWAVSPGAARPGVADTGSDDLRQLQQWEPAGWSPGAICDGREAEPGGMCAGGVADSHGARLEEHGGEPGDTRQEREAAVRGRWPAGRGEPQHPWEPPRLTQSGMGGGSPGGAAGLDGSAGGGREKAARIAAKREARFQRWCNAQRLRALGNANPPIVPELIGRWIIEQETR